MGNIGIRGFLFCRHVVTCDDRQAVLTTLLKWEILRLNFTLWDVLAISPPIIVRFSILKKWHTQEKEPVVRKIINVVRTAWWWHDKTETLKSCLSICCCLNCKRVYRKPCANCKRVYSFEMGSWNAKGAIIISLIAMIWCVRRMTVRLFG